LESKYKTYCLSYMCPLDLLSIGVGLLKFTSMWSLGSLSEQIDFLLALMISLGSVVLVFLGRRIVPFFLCLLELLLGFDCVDCLACFVFECCHSF
jgi:hypothetical protein